MSVAKVIEITSSSSKGFEDAIEQGVAKASKTIDGIKGAWVSEQKVRVGEDGKIEEYRVYMRLTFVLED
jgi:flavin-binding protein dodecin